MRDDIQRIAPAQHNFMMIGAKMGGDFGGIGGFIKSGLFKAD